LILLRLARVTAGAAGTFAKSTGAEAATIDGETDVPGTAADDGGGLTGSEAIVGATPTTGAPRYSIWGTVDLAEAPLTDRSALLGREVSCIGGNAPVFVDCSAVSLKNESCEPT